MHYKAYKQEYDHMEKIENTETKINMVDFLTRESIEEFPPKLGVWRLMGFEKFGKYPKILLYGLTKEAVEKYMDNARAHGYKKVYVEFHVYKLSSCDTMTCRHQIHYYYGEVTYGYSKTAISGARVHQGMQSYGDQIRIVCRNLHVKNLITKSIEEDQKWALSPKAWSEHYEQ